MSRLISDFLGPEVAARGAESKGGGAPEQETPDGGAARRSEFSMLNVSGGAAHPQEAEQAKARKQQWQTGGQRHGGLSDGSL